MGGKPNLLRAAAAFCAIAAGLCLPPQACGFIDPERPVSWLAGECRAIAALKITAVEADSATFAVVKVLRGEWTANTVTVRWTATQQPPVDRKCVDEPAVLLVPRDEDDPALLQVSPEFLSLKPDPDKSGEFEFVRLNGFVKGSFNGEAGDFIRLLEDTLNHRAYFPIWADTTFERAQKIGELPANARALAAGDLDGDGEPEIVAASPAGLVALVRTLRGAFVIHPLPGVPASTTLRLADADGDGRTDILTDSGLFLGEGDWQFSPAPGMSGTKWADACFCAIPGWPAPAVLAIASGRIAAFARDAGGTWTDVSGPLGLDHVPEHVEAISACNAGDCLVVTALTDRTLIGLCAGTRQPLRRIQELPLVGPNELRPRHPQLCSRDFDGDGLADVFLAGDGSAGLFRRGADRILTRIPDYLGDVRKVFQAIEGCAGLLSADFNNDGLEDLLVWSRSGKLALIMNRGYHNLREGTDLFDLPNATRDVKEIQVVAALDADADGDLDLVAANGKELWLLKNTFETKPEEANDRPRHPLLTVYAPGRFGAPVSLLDTNDTRWASQQVGSGAVADTVHFGYRNTVPAAVVLTTLEGKEVRRMAPPGPSAKPIVIR